MADEPGEGVCIAGPLLAGKAKTESKRRASWAIPGIACLAIQLRGVPPISDSSWGPWIKARFWPLVLLVLEAPASTDHACLASNAERGRQSRGGMGPEGTDNMQQHAAAGEAEGHFNTHKKN